MKSDVENNFHLDNAFPPKGSHNASPVIYTEMQPDSASGSFSLLGQKYAEI